MSETGLPEIRVEVGFTGPYVGDVFTIGDPVNGRVGSVPIGDDNTWVDISAWVRSWSVRRGAGQGNTPTRRYDPGTATIVLNDGDRRFDPDNLDGPYVSAGRSMIEPMRRVRITAIWAGVAYPIFQGFADDWTPDYQSNFWTYTTLTATDATKVWAATRRTAVAPVGANETSGSRINRVLNSIDWPVADRVIDAGSTTMQATDLAGSGLSELQLVQDTELGELFVDARGRAVFQGRESVLFRTESAYSQATFGDAGWMPPTDYEYSAGVSHFTAVGCTIGQSTAVAYPNPHSLLLTVTGSPTQAYARPVYPSPVEEGREYTATMWVYRPVAGNVVAAIDWGDASGNYLGGEYVTVAVPAATWTQLTVTGTPVPGTTGAWAGPTLPSSPTAGTELYLNAMQFATATQELPYADLTMSSLDDNLANRITIGREGGTPQVAEDTASIADYLVKDYERTDLLMQTDANALDYANALLYRHKDPVRHPSRIEFIRPARDVEDVVWPQVLGRLFGDRITVIRRPAGGGSPINRDVFVRGVEHQSDGEQWTTGFVLQPADRYSYFTIGHPDRGRVGAYPIAF